MSSSIANGGVSSKKKRLSYGEIVEGQGRAGSSSKAALSESRDRAAGFHVRAQMAEVEVDPESGEIKLRRFVTAHHTGKVLNPLLHDGQIDGSIVMGQATH